MDTEVKAVGNTPEIGENGNWFIDGEDTGYPAVARDGVTPTVGENGNWWLGDLDTGVPAKGQDGEKGEDGKDGTVAAGIDGAQINEEGDLILTLADGTTINAGTCPGRSGQFRAGKYRKHAACHRCKYGRGHLSGRCFSAGDRDHAYDPPDPEARALRK